MSITSTLPTRGSVGAGEGYLSRGPRRCSSPLASLLVSATVLSAHTIAHAADPAGPQSLDKGASEGSSDGVTEVTVSARRREENSQSVPIPIAVVSGEALERSGQFRLETLSQDLPSTNIQYNNPRQTSIAVRGLGNNPANDALESSVGVYFDNVYLGRASMANLDLIDIDQIALLRGPQGTLFGKNTTAGVLNVSTRKPSFTPEGGIETSYGDFGYYQVRGVWSQPLTSDTLAARVAFARTFSDGFVKNPTTGRDLNGTSRVGGRGQLLWQPGDTLSVRFIADYSEEHSDTGASVAYSLGPNGGTKYLNALRAAGASVVYDPNFETTTADARQHMDVRQGGGSAEANWQLGDYKLTSITAYRTWWFMPYNDGDGTNVDAIRLAGQHVDDNQWSQELRLSSPADRTLSYVIGLFYFNQHQDNLLFTQYGADAGAIAALGVGVPSFANGRTQTLQFLKTDSSSIFGQLTWRPNTRAEIALGLRDTAEQKNVALTRTSQGSAAFTTSPLFSVYQSGALTRNDNDVSALASASYRLSSDVLGYASVSRGAKSGGINPTAPVPGLTVESLYVKPEIATDGELGLKSTLLNRRLVLNADLYWTQVKDYQATLLAEPAGGGNLQQVLSNIGKVRTRGVEADVTALPFRGLTLRLSASYNDAVYLSYRDAPCSAEQLAAQNLVPGQKLCDLTGQALVGSPKWIVNPGISYSHGTFAGLTAAAQIDYSWRSWFFGSADNSQLARVPAYGVLNARYGIQGNWGGVPWGLSVWSNNILDKRYVLGGLVTAGRLYNYTETPGLPRTFGATLHVDFR